MPGVLNGFAKVRSFEPGLGKVDPWVAEGSANTMYYHANHLGTTRFMTDSPPPLQEPTASGHAVYTAFGELVTGTLHRYGYAGSWGYQAHNDLPFLHVGARYYDPGMGRFIQRDPIGLAGGLNVYEYGRSHPTVTIDPTGLWCEPPPPRSEWPKPPPGDGSGPPGFDQMWEDLESAWESVKSGSWSALDWLWDMCIFVGTSINPVGGPIIPIFEPGDTSPV